MTHSSPIAVDAVRPTWVLALDAMDEWPETLPFEDTPFSVLLVIDSRDVAEDGFRAWNTFARRAANQGMAYFSTWGPDCGRLHDIMDETIVGWEVIDEEPAPQHINTTWHANEDFDEALWFVQHVAFSPECQQGEEPCLIALIGRPDVFEKVKTCLAADVGAQAMEPDPGTRRQP